MSYLVVMGALMQCNWGVAPAPFMPTPTPKVMATGPAAGTIADMAPLVNVMPFGMCNSTSNPTVISLTAAALGVHTPAPCIPVPTGPWKPGSKKVMLGGTPALTDACALQCAWGGAITFKSSGQPNKVQVG